MIDFEIMERSVKGAWIKRIAESSNEFVENNPKSSSQPIRRSRVPHRMRLRS